VQPFHADVRGLDKEVKPNTQEFQHPRQKITPRNLRQQHRCDLLGVRADANFVRRFSAFIWREQDGCSERTLAPLLQIPSVRKMYLIRGEQVAVVLDEFVRSHFD
jgi:hypothetical protein